MKQGTLSAFLRRSPPRIHFCCSEDGHASFLVSPPKGYVRIGEASVAVTAGKRGVFLEVWRDPLTMKEEPAEPEPTKCDDVPLLISNLQKAVRRCRQAESAATALELSHVPTGFLALCRRLPVIAVEDCGRPDRDLVTCVWLMLANDKYRPRPKDVGFLERYAYALAAAPSRDEDEEEDDDDDGARKRRKVEGGSDWQRADERGDHVSMALLVRAAHGGMRWDVDLLRASGANDHSLSRKAATPRALEGFASRRLRREDVLPESADFHVDGSMAHKLVSRCKPGTTVERVKEAIWAKSSGVNARREKACDGETERLYWSFYQHLRALQGQRIDRAFRD